MKLNKHRIAEACELKGLNREQLAAKMGMTRTHLYRLIATGFSDKHLRTICDVLEVSIDKLAEFMEVEK